MFHLSDYSYDLPAEKIAQVPCKNRSGSKLLHVQRDSGALTHHRFKDLATLLRKDDLLVINNTRVIPARLLGRKASGGKIEVLIIDYAAGMNHLEKTGFVQCDCLLKASRKPKKGSLIIFEAGVEAEVVEDKGSLSVVRFFCPNGFLEFLNRFGEIPLPPYIKREDNALTTMDRTSYQTVYAAKEGAVAAPTAGLHFTEDLMAELDHRGIEFAPLTLHVGYGTFVPVKTQDIRDHQIHSEYFSVTREAADKINAARQAQRRIMAVGTTSVRVLEFISDDQGRVRAGTGMCNLFIYPGYRFKCTDALITNFHLPESSLLMLVSAFYDREKILAAYEEAVQKDYRFFSYGDAMFIE
ncbi:MAG: tRNA preQ1(34) S-adenosylmethionine ribosyltransferase-isomerase QueA [Desulfobacula sp.]|jgi:S-adenosylmethionine:tRNA ribosyltransferase-isomerase